MARTKAAKPASAGRKKKKKAPRKPIPERVSHQKRSERRKLLRNEACLSIQLRVRGAIALIQQRYRNKPPAAKERGLISAREIAEVSNLTLSSVYRYLPEGVSRGRRPL